jgi:hypothetical protein
MGGFNMQAATGETVSGERTAGSLLPLDTLGANIKARSVGAREQTQHRRTVAIHEAGHVTVARALGFKAWARIWPNENPSPNESLWLGNTSSELFRPGHVATGRQRRMIAVAGAAAEVIFQVNDCSELLEYVCLFADNLSATDWDLTGCAPGFPDNEFCDAVDDVGDLLNSDGEAWGGLLIMARQLIIDARLN